MFVVEVSMGSWACSNLIEDSVVVKVLFNVDRYGRQKARQGMGMDGNIWWVNFIQSCYTYRYPHIFYWLNIFFRKIMIAVWLSPNVYQMDNKH